MSLIRKVDIRDDQGVAFSATNPLYTHSVGEVSTDNSSSTPLGISGVFTGTGEDIQNESVIIVAVYSDVASATDGLSVQFSTDNANWDHVDVFTIAAATGKTFSFQPVAKYFRVVYTNGGTGQSAFRMQVLKHTSYVKPSSHRVADSISDQDDAELTKSVITGVDSAGNFQNVKTTSDGYLSVVNKGSGLDIASGDVTGSTFVHKFGEAPDFDTADGEVSLYDGADDGNINQMVYQYSATADIDSISSSNNGDTVDVEIQGLDTSYNLVTQTVTLTGQTRAALSTSLIRVFRMKNVGSTDLAGYVYCYVNSAITSGVPDDPTQVRAIIQNGNNQTLMALYTVPNGKTAYMRSFFASTAGANKSSNYIVKLKARPFGEVFQLKHKSSISDDGSSHVQHTFIEPEVFAAKTDIAMTVEVTALGVTGADFSGGFDIVLIDD